MSVLEASSVKEPKETPKYTSLFKTSILTNWHVLAVGQTSLLQQARPASVLAAVDSTDFVESALFPEPGRVWHRGHVFAALHQLPVTQIPRVSLRLFKVCLTPSHVPTSDSGKHPDCLNLVLLTRRVISAQWHRVCRAAVSCAIFIHCVCVVGGVLIGNTCDSLWPVSQSEILTEKRISWSFDLKWQWVRHTTARALTAVVAAL